MGRAGCALQYQGGNVNDVYVTRLRQELTGAAGFNPQAYDAAAQFCVQAGTHLDFPRLRIAQPAPFRFDERLLERWGNPVKQSFGLTHANQRKLTTSGVSAYTNNLIIG